MPVILLLIDSSELPTWLVPAVLGVLGGSPVTILLTWLLTRDKNRADVASVLMRLNTTIGERLEVVTKQLITSDGAVIQGMGAIAKLTGERDDLEAAKTDLVNAKTALEAMLAKAGPLEPATVLAIKDQAADLETAAKAIGYIIPERPSEEELQFDLRMKELKAAAKEIVRLLK